MSWAQTLRPDAPALVAIDGKTSRGSHDRSNGRAALHLVSAFATRERLVLGQEAVAAASGEQDTIPLLLQRLAGKGRLKGALVTIEPLPAMPRPREPCSMRAPITCWQPRPTSPV
jgi:hypothetical protein